MDMLAIGYLVVLLRSAFLGGTPFPEGKMLEVTRDARSAMVAGGIARDATDEEIAEFRGKVEGDSDGGELSAAKAELDTLAQSHSTLLEAVDALELSKQTLTGEVDELGTLKTELAEYVAGLEAKKETLAGELAALEKAKPAAKAAK